MRSRRRVNRDSSLKKLDRLMIEVAEVVRVRGALLSLTAIRPSRGHVSKVCPVCRLTSSRQSCITR